jgi:enamine deaminase RidA (YjgF/YER057c/UK114 family)
MMRTLLLPLAVVLLAGCAIQPRAPEKVVVIPAGRERAYDEYHYAPAVRVGDTVIVSGIPAALGETYEAQVRWMFERLKLTLEAAGASMDDVVEITTYHREAKDTAGFTAEFKRFLAVHQEYFPAGYPAWTAVGTTALLAEGAPVEMRAMAVVGSGKRLRVQREASGH